jgi:hypothetical protein
MVNREADTTPMASPVVGDAQMAGGTSSWSLEQSGIAERRRRPMEDDFGLWDVLIGLAELRDSGVLTPAEYEQAKAKVLA